MQKIKNKIIKKIEKYKNIAIYFHELPDVDALGSCYALSTFIKNKYPQKKIVIVGIEKIHNQFENKIFEIKKQKIQKYFFQTALGIILDTANRKRIWMQNYNLCKELIRIDHHPKVESIGKIEWIDDSYSSTTEMLGELLFAWDYTKINKIICNYLYAGLLTDTNRFLYSSVKPRTFVLASKLLAKGLDRERIHNALYLKSKNEVLLKNYLLSIAKIDTKFGYAWVKINKTIFSKFHIKYHTSMVNSLANIEKIYIWFSFFYDKTSNQWKGSIRSNKYPITWLAKKYHGGGHKFAAGMTFSNEHEMNFFINDVKKYLKHNLIDNNINNRSNKHKKSKNKYGRWKN